MNLRVASGHLARRSSGLSPHDVRVKYPPTRTRATRPPSTRTQSRYRATTALPLEVGSGRHGMNGARWSGTSEDLHAAAAWANAGRDVEPRAGVHPVLRGSP